MDKLDQALDLLRQLNSLTDNSGEKLSARVTVDGFEPWWFIQEQLFWRVLVPYTNHRELMHRMIVGEAVNLESAPSDAIALCRLLLDKGDFPFLRPYANQLTVGRKRRTVLNIIEWLLELSLALFSAISLCLYRLRRQNTLVYTIDKVSPGSDHDFRISSIYRELRRRDYRFGEYVHTSGLRTALKNLWKRRRWVVCFEVLTKISISLLPRRWTDTELSKQVKVEHADPDHIFLAAVARMALQWSQESAWEVGILKRLLRLQDVRRAVILDDSRHVNELLVACKSLGIPTLGYMHGLLNRYHPGLMAYEFGDARRHTFDLYGFWSEYFRQRVLAGKLYDETNTMVSGPLRPPAHKQLLTIAKARRHDLSEVRVLLVSEPRAPQKEVLSYIEQLLGDEQFRLIVKMRPGEEQLYLATIAGAPADSLSIIYGGSVYEAFAQADVVLATYSTVLYEATLALCPAVLLNTSFSYGRDVAEDGLVEFAESPEYICEAVLGARRLPEEELIRRRDLIWGKEYLADGASRLFDVAETKLWEK